MKFVCDRCQTRYSIADEKVRQKILHIRCKTCGGVILVHGGELDVADRSSEDGSSASVIRKMPPFPPVHPHPLPRTPPLPTLTAEKVGTNPPDDRAEWYLGIDGTSSGPFARAEVFSRIFAAVPKSVHVWKQGMSAWKPWDEVAVLAREAPIEGELRRERAKLLAVLLEKCRQEEARNAADAKTRLEEMEKAWRMAEDRLQAVTRNGRDVEAKRREVEIRLEEVEKARLREEDERKKSEARLLETEKGRREDEAKRREAEVRLEEVEKARLKEEDERKRSEAHRLAVEKERREEETRRRDVEAKLERSEKALQGNRADLESTRSKLAEMEKRTADEAAAKDDAQGKAKRLEDELTAKRQSRDEASRLLETASSLRARLDASRRSTTLDPDTQKARRNIVAVSGVAIALSIGRIAPSEINVIGVKFSEIVPSSIRLGIAGVVVYLLIAFYPKARVAVEMWRKETNDLRSLLQKLENDQRLKDLTDQVPSDVALLQSFLANIPPPIGRLNSASFSDFYMPIALATAAIVTSFLGR